MEKQHKTSILRKNMASKRTVGLLARWLLAFGFWQAMKRVVGLLAIGAKFGIWVKAQVLT